MIGLHNVHRVVFYALPVCRREVASEQLAHNFLMFHNNVLLKVIIQIDRANTLIDRANTRIELIHNTEIPLNYV